MTQVRRTEHLSSAEDWDELLLPEVERLQPAGKQVAFRGDAAFARPEVYESPEASRRRVGSGGGAIASERTRSDDNSVCRPTAWAISGGGGGLPHRIKSWSLTSLQQRLMETDGRLVKRLRSYWTLLADGHLNRKLFRAMSGRVWALRVPGGSRRRPATNQPL